MLCATLNHILGSANLSTHTSVIDALLHVIIIWQLVYYYMLHPFLLFVYEENVVVYAQP